MKRSIVMAVVGLVALTVGGSVPAATPAQSRPAMSGLAYHGLGRDVVGRLAVAMPNGERDAQFTVTLRTGAPVVLKGVVLQRVFANGGYAESWDTYRGTSASVLGTVLDGKRLNKGDDDVSIRLAPGAHRLVLYANDHYGVFAPGQLFRATAAFLGDTTARATTKLAGSPPSMTATYQGLGEDVAGRGTDQKPNGEPDAHFTLTLDTHGSWQIVDDVVLRRLTPTGALDVPIFHMQGPQTAGLKVEGRRVLWPTEMPWWISVYLPVNPKASPVKLDLYANDPTPAGQSSSLFGAGQQYRLTVHFTDSALMPETFAIVRIP
jgi:hypothetical protein